MSGKDPKDRDEHTESTSIVVSEVFKLKMAEAKASPPTILLLMGPLSMIGKQWAITTDQTLMGRLAECDIFVDDRSLSRKHAVFRRYQDQVFVEDMGSANGTEVNNKKIKTGEATLLKDNDQIKVGQVIFKYLAEGNIEIKTTKETFDRALIDPLTQVANKRAFLEKVEEAFKKAKLTEVALSVIVFDLDNFKKVNDTYGHQAGDYVLKEVARIVKERVRPGDFFARYGGEEFAVLVTGGVLRVGVELAERLRIAIDEHEFAYQGRLLNVSISAGVAVLEENMATWEDLFDKADKASYKSKQNGKNQVSTL